MYNLGTILVLGRLARCRMWTRVIKQEHISSNTIQLSLAIEHAQNNKSQQKTQDNKCSLSHTHTLSCNLLLLPGQTVRQYCINDAFTQTSSMLSSQITSEWHKLVNI